MSKVKVNIDSVIANIRKSVDLSKNMKPFFRFILGKVNEKPSSENWYKIRPSIIDMFFKTRDPNGKPWPELKEITREYKSMHYPGKSMLRRSDRLLKSLWDYTDETVYFQTDKRLIFGTTVPYAKFHMTGTDNMAKRQFMGLSKNQKKEIKKLLSEYLRQPFTGKKMKGIE